MGCTSCYKIVKWARWSATDRLNIGKFSRCSRETQANGWKKPSAISYVTRGTSSFFNTTIKADIRSSNIHQRRWRRR